MGVTLPNTVLGPWKPHFTAALLEDVPPLDFAPTVSNGIDTAMWARGTFLAVSEESLASPCPSDMVPPVPSCGSGESIDVVRVSQGERRGRG